MHERGDARRDATLGGPPSPTEDPTHRVLFSFARSLIGRASERTIRRMQALLELHGISKTLGGRLLFDGVDLTVADTQRIAVIGRNGAGKTTLMQVLLGKEKPDAGTVRYLDGLRLGSVEQHEKFVPGETAIAYLTRETGKPEWECGKLAARFQVKNSLLGTACDQLSGGYQMRVRLAAMLLRDPNLLILDEPTNYLDLATLLLLEDFLRTFRGGYLIVSHDRQFLKNTCTSTLEVGGGKARFYPGPLEDYFAQKEQELAFQLKTKRRIDDERLRLQSFVDRFRAKASKASQAQSKLKQLHRLQTIEIDHTLPVPRINIMAQRVPPGYALRTVGLGVGYGERIVAKGIELDIQRGDHVVLAGENGQGKSTFLKTVAGYIPPLEGRYKWWPKASLGYYDQHVLRMLRPEETVENFLARSAASDLQREDILRMAGDFLFRGDDLEKQTKVLSGGERARLCLAALLLQRHAVLLLDEPTNHLDVETAEALAVALSEYPGTVLFVSHDRTFVQIVANRILEVRDGTVRQYLHTYEEYVQDMEQRLEDDVRVAMEPAADKAEARIRHERLTELKRDVSRLEKKMEEWDKKKSKLMAFFFENPLDYDPEKRRQLEEANEALGMLEGKWYELQTEIQGLRG